MLVLLVTNSMSACRHIIAKDPNWIFILAQYRVFACNVDSDHYGRRISFIWYGDSEVWSVMIFEILALAVWNKCSVSSARPKQISYSLIFLLSLANTEAESKANSNKHLMMRQAGLFSQARLMWKKCSWQKFRNIVDKMREIHATEWWGRDIYLALI